MLQRVARPVARRSGARAAQAPNRARVPRGQSIFFFPDDPYPGAARKGGLSCLVCTRESLIRVGWMVPVQPKPGADGSYPVDRATAVSGDKLLRDIMLENKLEMYAAYVREPPAHTPSGLVSPQTKFPQLPLSATMFLRMCAAGEADELRRHGQLRHLHRRGTRSPAQFHRPQHAQLEMARSLVYHGRYSELCL
jgi:hypothetical protein